MCASTETSDDLSATLSSFGNQASSATSLASNTGSNNDDMPDWYNQCDPRVPDPLHPWIHVLCLLPGFQNNDDVDLLQVFLTGVNASHQAMNIQISDPDVVIDNA